MSQVDWNLPQTEEGLQEALRRIEASQDSGDLVELGNGLLALSFLVKWVRSDTKLPPFARSHELALQALEVFRQANHPRGLVRALINASPFSPPEARSKMLEEAEVTASGLDDERLVASVLAARARSMAMSDREGAKALNIQTLETFRKVGSAHDQASCLFALSIGPGSSEEKRDYALEAADLYRSNGDPANASRCISIALMNAEEIEPLGNLEALVNVGLQDAKAASNAGQTSSFYGKLALIAVEKGRLDEAEEYRRLTSLYEDADGLTPYERWENDVEMTKTIIDLCRVQGDKEGEKSFREELKRLKSDKPKR